MPTIEEVDAYAPDQDDEWGRWMYSFWNIYPGTRVDAYEEERLDDDATGDSVYREDRLWSYRYNYASGPQVVPVAMLRVSELIGSDVRTYEGEIAGRINDLVVNAETGQVLLVGMEPSSAMDTQWNNYLVPLSAFAANRETETIVFGNEDYDLPSSLGFDDNWPALTERSLHDRIEQEWGNQGAGIRYGAGMQMLPMRLVPDTVVDNYEVFTRDSESLGEIEDLLIRNDGKIVYATF